MTQLGNRSDTMTQLGNRHSQPNFLFLNFACLLIVWLFPCDCRSTANLGIEKQLLRHSCRNTVQGRFFLTDEDGYICSIRTLNSSSGCCPRVSEPFQCHGCNLAAKCCNSYEYCVSCCLNPNQTSSELAMKVKVAQQASAGTYKSHFDFCLGRCRHDSKSVIHENAYAIEEHHCFALPSNLSPPSTKAVDDNILESLSIVISRRGQSCETACKLKGLGCQFKKLSVINKCSFLHKYFSCKGSCVASMDQPSEVSPTAPRHLYPGACLFASQESVLTCQGFNPHTRRLCPCS